MKRTYFTKLATATVAAALIAAFGVGCSDNANPVTTVDERSAGSLVDKRDIPSDRFEFTYTGIVERVDFEARVLYFLKVEMEVIVPQTAEIRALPSKALVPFDERHIQPGMEVTALGYYKGDAGVAEFLQVQEIGTVILPHTGTH